LAFGELVDLEKLSVCIYNSVDAQSKKIRKMLSNNIPKEEMDARNEGPGELLHAP